MIAQLKKEEYWLYLINRKEMNNPMYTPVMIQNPYEKLLRQDSSWNKQIEKYKIQLLVK